MSRRVSTYKGSAKWRPLPAWPSGFGEPDDARVLRRRSASTTSSTKTSCGCRSGAALRCSRSEENQRRQHDPRTISLGRADGPVFRGGVYSRRSDLGGDGDAAQFDVGARAIRRSRTRKRWRTSTCWARRLATCAGRRRSGFLSVPRNWKFWRRFPCRGSSGPTTI